MYGVHEDNTKCLDCYDNYYQPNENGECVIDLCSSYEDGTCRGCFEYFYLDENGNCTLIPFPYCGYGNKTHCRSWV